MPGRFRPFHIAEHDDSFMPCTDYTLEIFYFHRRPLARNVEIYSKKLFSCSEVGNATKQGIGIKFKNNLDYDPMVGLYIAHPVPSHEGRLISVVRCWGGERWLAGVSEIRRNKPISGPSRVVVACCRTHGLSDGR
jgi:hypothetical protein